MRHVEKYLHEGESVLIPRKGTLNNVMLVDGRFWTVDTMFYAKELMEGAARYAYFILSKMDLASMNAGSAVPSMTTKILSAIPVALPSEALLAEMKEWSDPLFERIRLNDRESENLSALRDVLLPKLMSGMIDVSQVDLPKQPNNHLRIRVTATCTLEKSFLQRCENSRVHLAEQANPRFTIRKGWGSTRPLSA